ncbi:acyltransferase family protein [Halopseudomonas pelagia]|uniref:Acyltransferase n=1 Tax=Halopseudomonas pelagia TaxID=553151 RepID=A0AA91Z4R0_9GAMM|nr:acyltransferase family protein [Halopseudomonas pelagia]PCC97879.1 acyltransferase [Halopseudomonas pelagia]QFY56144.1 acyltransferase [Halopseudomonas pelagia]
MKIAPGYRADIEGLRALAVVLVILYHYEVPGISGGFIGVDVFFVISGYVITQLLQRNFEKAAFSFRDFYARRIRRLVPLFLVVSSVTFVMISPFYLGDAYYLFAKSWLASLFGLSNIYYFQELSQYFAPESRSLSLLHTWSLAVEEQFYLIWPLALYLAYRFGKGRNGHWPFRITLVATFALSVYLADAYPAAAYYLLPARLFEFMLGTGVALFSRQLPVLGRLSAELLAALGLAMICVTAIVLTKHDHFPGYNALWPTLGTALVIYAGLHQSRTLTARLLSLPVMVFLGGISYSLYLWHWPPVALLHYQLIELTWSNRLLLIGIVVVLSWLSFRFVENRYRHRPWNLKKSFLIFILAPALIIWAIQSTIRIADDLSFRIPEDRRELYRIISQNNAADLYKRCFKGAPAQFNTSEACLFGAEPQDGQPDSILIGDSHAIALLGFVEQLIGDEQSLLVVTRASTPFVIPEHSVAAFVDPEKVERNTALANYLQQRPMTVYVNAWWNSYLQNELYQTYFIDTLAWLDAQGHNVVVIEDVPELPSSSYAECLLKNMDDCSIDAADARLKMSNFLRFKEAAQQRFPDINWIDPRKVICDQLRCQTVLNGIPLYRDENHLNYVGSTEIGREYVERFGSPLGGVKKPGDN